MLVMLQTDLRQKERATSSIFKASRWYRMNCGKRRLYNVLGKISPLYIQRWGKGGVKWVMLALAIKLHYVSYWNFFYEICCEELLPFHIYSFIILIPQC